MPAAKKFELFEAVQVVNDEGLDVPEWSLGRIGTVVKVYDDNTYDVQFAPRGETVNFAYYQIETPTV